MPSSDSKLKVPRWPIWSILWRMLLLMPIVGTIGLLVFLATLLSLFGPPFFVFILVMESHPLLAFLTLAGWLIWLPFGGRFLKWLMQGFEYSSL